MRLLIAEEPRRFENAPPCGTERREPPHRPREHADVLLVEEPFGLASGRVLHPLPAKALHREGPLAQRPVIKTVGDEVLFVAVEPLAGTAIALDLVDAMAEEPMLPQVRVGVAFGQVLSRMGDVFGTTVNRASRLTAVAPSGRVLVDESLAARLASLSGFDLHPLRRRHLRGIGMVTPSDVTRSRGARLPTALAGR